MRATACADGTNPTGCRTAKEGEVSPFLPEYISATMSQVQRLKDTGARLFLVLQDLGVVERPATPKPSPDLPSTPCTTFEEDLKVTGVRDTLRDLRQGLEDAAEIIENARAIFEREVI